jgi:hypothetical protein
VVHSGVGKVVADLAARLAAWVRGDPEKYACVIIKCYRLETKHFKQSRASNTWEILPVTLIIIIIVNA